MRDVLEIIARRELRAFDHFLDGGDRRDQISTLDRELKQLILGAAAREVSDDLLDALEFRNRFGAADQQLAVGDPILVAGGLIAKALRADEMHQPGSEDAERRAEQESHRNVTVAGRPDQRKIERAELYSAQHPARFGRSERRRKDV